MPVRDFITKSFGYKKEEREDLLDERKIMQDETFSVFSYICEKYGLEIAEETQGRGKTFTPDEYKKMRDEAKEELKNAPDILDEIKEEIMADFEDDLFSEHQHLVDEIAKHRQEVSDLQDKKTTLQDEVKQGQENVKTERSKLKTEQKNFKDMQLQFKPRKDDLEKIQKLKQETTPNLLKKITLTKDDWDFIINIAEQHARISDTTLIALEKHNKTTEALKRCQSLYLAVASEVAALDYPDRSKLTGRVSDVLKDIEDWRAVSWLIDDIEKHKPSDLEEILKIRQAKINKKYNFAKKGAGL